MARLLENQAKELLREANTMSGESVEGFAAVAFPIVRRVFAGLIANDLVSVQPMSLPSGLIFFGGDLGGTTDAQSSRFGNLADKSIYGTDRVASQITGGVNLVGDQGENLSGPRQAVGLAFASPTASVTSTTSAYNLKGQFDLGTSISYSDAKLIQFDPDLINLGSTYKAIVVDVARAAYDTANADFDNLSAFDLQGTALNTALSGAVGSEDNGTYTLVRRLTDTVLAADSAQSADSVRYVVTALSATVGNVAESGDWVAQVPEKDSIAAGAGTAAGALGSYNYPLEGNENIPEIDIKVDSIAITAQTKKLKAKWTPELGQDLNAYHNLDAEVELTSILSEQIALEIDREILADLVNGATAGTFYWSRSPGLFVNRETGEEIGASANAPDFTGTVSEWYETLIETINDVSAQIHRKTLRGGANFVVCGPEVANILEFTAGFRANVTADADKGDIGAVNVGSLSRKFYR
jgi:hypothetical protein